MRGVNELSFEGWGYREIAEASELLNALVNNNTTRRFENYFDATELSLGFDTGTGDVFLVDENYHLGMINDKKLDLWIDGLDSRGAGFFEDLSYEAQMEALEIYSGIDRK